MQFLRTPWVRHDRFRLQIKDRLHCSVLNIGEGSVRLRDNHVDAFGKVSRNRIRYTPRYYVRLKKSQSVVVILSRVFQVNLCTQVLIRFGPRFLNFTKIHSFIFLSCAFFIELTSALVVNDRDLHIVMYTPVADIGLPLRDSTPCRPKGYNRAAKTMKNENVLF